MIRGDTEACLLAVVACACAPASAELSVDLRTDLVGGQEFDQVELTLFSDDRAIEDSLELDIAYESANEFLLGRRVYENRSLGLGVYSLRIRLWKRNRVVLQRVLRVTLETDFVTTVVLTRTCFDVACDGGTSCYGGECRSSECSSETLSACGAPACESDAECSSSSDCSTPRCVDGVCLQAALLDACGAGQWCQPGFGCRFVVADPDERLLDVADADLIGWWRTDEGVVVGEGSFVSTWENQRVGGPSLESLDGGDFTPPILNQTSPPSIDFGGASRLDLSVTYEAEEARTQIVVLRITNSSQFDTVYTANLTNVHNLGVHPTGYLFAENTPQSVQTPIALDGRFHVIAVVESSGRGAMWFDGEEVDHADAWTPSAVSGVNFGDNFSGVNGFGGALGDVILYRRALEPSELSQISAILLERWQ